MKAKASMKIAFVNSFYYPDVGGGAEIVLKETCENLAALGHDISVIATTNSPTQSVSHENGVKVYRVKLANIYWHLRKRFPTQFVRLLWYLIDIYNPIMAARLKKILTEISPDVVVVHNIAGWSIAGWVEGRRLGIPVVSVLHDSYVFCPSSLMFKNGRACERQCAICKVLRAPYKSASKQVNAAVGVSKFISSRASNLGYFENAIRDTIYNGRRIETSLANTAERYSGPIRFGFIGTIMPAKGVTWLIRQFALIQGGSELIIAGAGSPDYIKYLKAIASKNVNFIGYVEPGDFFRLIDVCVVPSIWPDTLPGVAVESCAYGVPVIASNRGGLPEIIKDDVNGLVCNPDDESSLGAAIEKLANNGVLRERLAAGCQISVTDFTDRDRMIQQYVELFEELTVSGVDFR